MHEYSIVQAMFDTVESRLGAVSVLVNLSPVRAVFAVHPDAAVLLATAALTRDEGTLTLPPDSAAIVAV